MINASTAWKQLHQQALLPETNVEITYRIATDPAAVLTVEGVNPSSYSPLNLMPIVAPQFGGDRSYRGTLEHNVWALDGEALILDAGMCYMGDENASETGLSVWLTEPTTATIPGITITWSQSEQEGCATDFVVTAKFGNSAVRSVRVMDNTSLVSEVDMELEGYDTIEIEILEWSLPNRRPRIWAVELGHTLVYDKNSIMSYEYIQEGHPNTGEIPQVTVRFALDNSDDLWNPFNPSGNTKYLTERLKIDIRYGLNVDGITEWIVGGSAFLSEWNTPSNGLEASFVAKGAFEFLQNQSYTGDPGDTLHTMAVSAARAADASGFGVGVVTDNRLKNYPSVSLGDEVTSAVVLQMCANAACCLIKPNRSDARVVLITPTAQQYLEYTIPSALSYAHPEIEFSKPLKAVSVSYKDSTTGEEKVYVLNVASSGETQTVSNELISSEEQAAEVAEWVKNTLESRKTVKGEFRADPRLDLFDIVTVESKYGSIYPVLITYIKYTFNGSFRATYEGRVITLPEEV